MIDPRRRHQECFDSAAPAFLGATEDECANGFRAGCPTRLPRDDWIDGQTAQMGGERLNLGRLAGTFPTLERNENASFGLSPLRAQPGAPQMRYSSVPVILPSTPARSTASAATSGKTRVGWSATVSSIWPMT